LNGMRDRYIYIYIYISPFYILFTAGQLERRLVVVHVLAIIYDLIGPAAGDNSVRTIIRLYSILAGKNSGRPAHVLFLAAHALSQLHCSNSCSRHVVACTTCSTCMSLGYQWLGTDTCNMRKRSHTYCSVCSYAVSVTTFVLSLVGDTMFYHLTS
jgi:hypothetical protein